MTINSCYNIIIALYMVLACQHLFLLRCYSKYRQYWVTMNSQKILKFIPDIEDMLIFFLLFTVFFVKGNNFGVSWNVGAIVLLLLVFFCFIVMQCLSFYSIELQKRIDRDSEKLL